MRGPKGFGAGSPMDLGTVFDEIFEAAQTIQDEFQRKFTPFEREEHRDRRPYWSFDEHTDYYPNYSYPPMNVYMTADRSLIFEFALAGFDEKDISLSFQGDYMVFSATIPKPDSADCVVQEEDCNNRYFKRRLKMKDILKQKYFVPLDKYAQEKVKAVYKNGILRVAIPPKDEPDQNDGIRIEIVKEEA
jgi:HSP20 family molecular chaperone IbpA